MDRQLSILNQSVLLTMIIILYYMYTSICASIFTLNQCRQYGSHGLWHVEDLDISCNTDTHFWHVLGISIPGYLFYVFGIPAAIIYCVYTNKSSLTEYDTRKYLGVLYAGYKFEYYWWEAVIMFRKSVLVACICIFLLLWRRSSNYLLY